MGHSIRADIGQLLWVGFEGTAVDDDLSRRIADGDVGGVILFSRNVPRAGDATDVAALVGLNQSLHDVATDVPLLIAVDQEGGLVQRVKAPATVWPPMLGVSRLRDDEAEAFAREVGAALGRELAALGFDVDFAPVLDVHTNPANPVIGNRAFATTPKRAADTALAFADGLASSGVLGCGKHFPGHGDTSSDSHLELPHLEHDMARLESVELLPFRMAAERGLPMLMTAHVVFSALDPAVPATLSKAVITELLRNDMGYRGVIVSDDLDMKAIADHYGVADAAVRAIAAGCDVLLLCRNREHQQQAFEGLIRGCEDSSSVRDRVREAAARVLQLKRGQTIIRPALTVLGAEPHRALAARLRSAAHD